MYVCVYKGIFIYIFIAKYCCVSQLCVRSQLTRQLNSSSCSCTQRCSRYAPIPAGTRTGKEFCLREYRSKFFQNYSLILLFIPISDNYLKPEVLVAYCKWIITDGTLYIGRCEIYLLVCHIHPPVCNTLGVIWLELPSGYHGYWGIVVCGGVHAEAEETVELLQFFLLGANWGWRKSWASTVCCRVAQPGGSSPMDNIYGLFAVIISTQAVQLHVHTVAVRRVTAHV
jgi:hypothetical protein